MKSIKEDNVINQKKINKKSKNLLNNTILFLISGIGSKLIQFILVPLYTYTLTTSQYGVTEIIITAVNILIPIFSISISDGFLRFGLNKKYDKEMVTSIVLKILLLGSFLSILFIPLFKMNEILSKYLFFFLIILNLRMYRDVLTIRLKIYNKNKLFAIDGILYTFILCISNLILLIFFKLNITGYLLSYVIANIFSILFVSITSKLSIKTIFKKIDKNIFKKIIVYSLPMVINGVSWWITNASDKFMLSWLMTESDVGIYSIATKLPTFISTFTSIFNQAWLISAVIEFDNEKEKKFYSTTFRNYYALSFMVCSLLILIIKPFIKIYVSEEYYIAWKYAPILIASASSSGIAAFIVGIYAASMKNINVTITTVIGGIINIILNYILIPQIGIMGAAIATYISWTLIAIIRILNIRKIFKFEINYKKLFGYFMLLFVQTFAVVVLNNICGQLISLFISIIFVVIERKLIVQMYELTLNKLKNKLKRVKNNENKEII